MDLKPWAIIPARAGSKRLPNKNMMTLAGKPLVAWSIEAAIESAVFSRIVVSSDSEDILQVAHDYGVDACKRDASISDDVATTDLVIKHVLEHHALGTERPTAFALLQPTTPLRTAGDIQNGWAVYVRESSTCLIGVSTVDHPTEWNGFIGSTGEFLGHRIFSIQRSQEAQKVHRINGALYLRDTEAFLGSGRLLADPMYCVEMPREHSVDIDELIDFRVAEELAKDRGIRLALDEIQDRLASHSED